MPPIPENAQHTCLPRRIIHPRDWKRNSDLNRVEMEDEEVVEAVQKGVKSRLYDRGRYSPRREVGTHQFHRLLERTLAPPPQPATTS